MSRACQRCRAYSETVSHLEQTGCEVTNFKAADTLDGAAKWRLHIAVSEDTADTGFTISNEFAKVYKVTNASSRASRHAHEVASHALGPKSCVVALLIPLRKTCSYF